MLAVCNMCSHFQVGDYLVQWNFVFNKSTFGIESERESAGGSYSRVRLGQYGRYSLYKLVFFLLIRFGDVDDE